MKFFISLEISAQFRHLSESVMQVEGKILNCFKQRNYGPDLETIFIGMIIVDEKSSSFHPKRSLEYKKRFKFNDILTGKKIELTNVASLDVVADYSIVKESTAEAFEHYLSLLLMEAGRTLEQNHHLFPDFNLALFLTDLQECLFISEGAEPAGDLRHHQ